MEWPLGHDGICDRFRNRTLNGPRHLVSGWSGVTSKSEQDLWVPEDKSGYASLFYLGLMMAALGIGGNIAIQSLWETLQDLTELI